jgi:hypothetical protein
VQLRSDSRRPAFVGIGPAAAVDRYLGNVSRAEVSDLNDGSTDYRIQPGGRRPAAPDAQSFWAATLTGSGAQTLHWKARDGNWRVVLMNPDATRGVRADLSVGATLPNLVWAGVGIVAGGAVLLAVGGLMIYLGARRHSHPPATPATETSS